MQSLAETITSCTTQWSHDGEHPVTFAAFREIPEKRFGTPAASRSQTELSALPIWTMRSSLLLIKRQKLFERQ